MTEKIENLASMGKRVFGAIIDMIVLFVIFTLFGVFFGEVEGLSVSVTGLPALVMFLIWVAYFVVMEATTGKTIGKYVAKTRVANEAGERISWGQSTGRNLMRIIDGFLFYLVGFIAIRNSKDKRRLGDMVSKTYVVGD